MNKVIPILIIISIAASSCSDKNSPAVTIVSPSENEEVSGTIMVKVVASDDEKMDRVELYVDDELLSSIEGDKDIYTFFWDTDVRENGVVSLFAKAYDEAGNSKKIRHCKSDGN